MTVVDILVKYRSELFAGIWVTLKLCLLIYPIGVSLGSLLGIARHKWRFFIGIPSSFLSILLSSTPIIVFLFWLHYPLQYLLNVVIDPFKTSVFALSVLMIFLVSDITKNALDNFPTELLQSAKVCGLSYRESIVQIQLPIIYRQILPNILFVMISILQATLFTSLISVEEIFRVAQQINADVYKPVEIYTSLALFFIIICMSLNLIAFWVKSKYKWSLTEN